MFGTPCKFSSRFEDVMQKLVLALTLSFLFVGCDYSYRRGTEKAPNDQVTQADVITFQMINERVIQPRCVGCHSEASGNKGKVNLENYENVLTHKNAIYREVVDRTMPPRHKEPLTAEQVKLIADWIDQGAYEFGAPVDIGHGVSDTIITGNEEIDPTLTQELEQHIKGMSDEERKTIETVALAKVTSLAPNMGASFPQVVVTEEGYTVLFADANRTALLFESNTEKFDFKLKVDLTENLCQAEYIKPKCNYYMDFANDYMVFRWVKHSDAAKIGQTVKMKFPSFGDADFIDKKVAVFYSFNDRFIGRKQDLRFKPDRLVCDHYDWLDPEITRSQKALFQSWSSETMAINSETDINENTTSEVFESVEWKLQNKALVLQSIARIQSKSSFGKPTPLLPSGQASTIQYQKSQDEACQFSFSHSVQSAAAGFDFDKNYNSNPRFVVYSKPRSTAYKAFKSQVLDSLTFISSDNPPEIEP